MLSYEKIGFRQIESFYYAAKTGSFTGAAKELRISQPTISGHIAHLEHLLGVPLFERMGKRIRLTEAGRIYFGFCERMIGLREEAHRAVEEFTGLLRGTLLLGASNIPAVYILPPLIADFKSEFPNVTVSMRVGDSADVERSVVGGEYHLGFIGRKSKNESLRSEVFADDEVVLVARSDAESAQDYISIRHLKRLPLVVREEGSATLAAFYRALKRRGLASDSLNIVAVLGSTEAVKRAVRAGVGFGVVSLRAVEDEVNAGLLKVVRVKGLSVKRNFYWICRASGVLPPAAHRFIKMLRRAKLHLKA